MLPYRSIAPKVYQATVSPAMHPQSAMHERSATHFRYHFLIPVRSLHTRFLKSNNEAKQLLQLGLYRST